MITLCPLFSQEALKSYEEEYYDFLSLTGHTKREFLTYRTMDDSRWHINEETEDFINVWSGKSLGKTFDSLFGVDFLSFKLYGTELFTSLNTEYPFGAYDGALWQGKGFNAAFSTGFRMEAAGFSVSFRPQVSFSQNREFEIMKARSGISEYGYFHGGCDAPQRFGDSSFYTFDWGDTEVRYTWKKFTVGFGTQSVWLGPTEAPVLLSNNAPTFPKFDIGLRRAEVKIPFTDIYIGDIETRLWVGYLTESDYFDSNEENDHNQYSGFTFSYSPAFAKGLTLGVTKVTLNKWGERFWQYALPFFIGNTIYASDGNSGEDMKAAITVDWLFDKIGLDIYGELGFDDFLSGGFSIYEYARYPFHAMTYTVGMKKTFEISKEKKLRGLLQFEWNDTEGSQDYQLWSGSDYNFGFHGQITQGYTNRGQWLGSGIGYGGNSQKLSFTLYSPHGYEKLFIGRNNIDNNYVFYQAVDADKEETEYNGRRYYTAFKANFYIGFENLFFILNNLSLRCSIVYDLVINPTYEPGSYLNINNAIVWREYDYLNNMYFSLAVKYTL